MSWLVLFGWAVLWILVGWKAGSEKGQQVSGAVWCGLLGPIGLLVLYVLPDARTPPADAGPRPEGDAEVRARIEKEERIRAEVRAKIEAEERAKRGA